MRTIYYDNIKTNTAAAIRDMARARESMARGEYGLAQSQLMHAVESLTQAIKWDFCTVGDADNARTPDETADIYAGAVVEALKTAKDWETNPEQVETVADLRAKLRAGDARAADLVNDLISDNPNQATAWITRADIDEHADDLTDEQRAALMDYIRNDYELIDTSAEITNAQETMDELNR